MVWPARVSAGLLAAIAVLTGVDVFCRKVLNYGITDTVAIVEVTFVIIMFFAFAQVKATGREIRIDALVQRLPSKAAHVCNMIGTAVSCLFFGIITYGGVHMWYAAWQIHEMRHGVLMIPMILPLGGLVLGSVFMVVAQISSLIESARAVLSAQQGQWGA